MERKSQVQIPKDLLLALFQYHLARNEEYLPEIEKALMEKLDSKGRCFFARLFAILASIKEIYGYKKIRVSEK